MLCYAMPLDVGLAGQDMVNLSTLVRAFAFDLAAAFVLDSAHSDCHLDQLEFRRATSQRFSRRVPTRRTYQALSNSPVQSLELVPETSKRQLTPHELYK